MTDLALQRLQKKLAKRDRRIEGMQRYIRHLEGLLRPAIKSRLEILSPEVQRQLTYAVQRAIANVRMIPVLGIHSNDRVVRVEVENAKGERHDPQPS